MPEVAGNLSRAYGAGIVKTSDQYVNVFGLPQISKKVSIIICLTTAFRTLAGHASTPQVANIFAN